MTFGRALRSRPFAMVWLGQTVSRFGDAVFIVALAWWVLESTGSATAMGAVLIVEVIPTLLFLLVGGVAVDRLPRLRVMLAADLLRASVVGIVAVLASAGTLELWHVLAAAATFGAVTGFFYPAFSAAIPDIVPSDDLSSANALVQLSARVAQVVGPGIGAGIVAGFGTGGAFAVDALTYLVSGVAVIAALHGMPTDRPIGRRAGILHDLREGFSTVLGVPWLWVTITVAAASTVTLAGPLEAALPFLVSRDLMAGVEIFGLLGSLSAAGAIVAAICLGRRRRIRRRGIVMYGAWLLSALMVVIMGLPVGILGVSIAMTIAGGALAALGLVWTNSLQELVRPDLRGRVASIDALGSSSLLPVGFAVTGLATDAIGPSSVFVLGGLLSLVVIGAGFLHPEVRGMD